MKQLFTLFLGLAFTLNVQAVSTAVNPDAAVAEQVALSGLNLPNNLDGEAFLELTPKKVREMTGERLGIGGSIALKMAQRSYKKSLKRERAADIPQVLYIIGAIFGFAWLLMGIMDSFEGNNWWISLLLYILFFLPGIIFAFIKMNEYY